MKLNMKLNTNSSGVKRALQWLERELFLCTEEELYSQFEKQMNCKFSEDKTEIIFITENLKYWFTTRWR